VPVGGGLKAKRGLNKKGRKKKMLKVPNNKKWGGRGQRGAKKRKVIRNRTLRDQFRWRKAVATIGGKGGGATAPANGSLHKPLVGGRRD